MNNRETFSDHNEYFFSRFKNPEIFDCEDFNLLKVVQHAVVRQNPYVNKPYIFLPTSLYKIVLFLKRIRHHFFSGHLKIKKQQFYQGFEKIKDREFLLLDVDRTIKDEHGKEVSTYYQNLLQLLGPGNCIFLYNTPLKKKGKITHDLTMNEVSTFYSFLPMSKEEGLFLKHLRLTYYKVRDNTSFSKSEQKNIKRAFDLFFTNFRMWSSFSKNLGVKKCFIIPHYIKEAQILALKQKGIHVTELQHGLIASEDIFYIYPEQIRSISKKALFADQIFVYGQYWKELLLKGSEYAEEQIKIIGYYLYQSKTKNQKTENFFKEHIPGSSTIILIATQTWLYSEFIAYTKWLSNDIKDKQQDAYIILKPHPAEPIDRYDELKDCYHTYVLWDNINDLFPYVHIQVSVYSTTFFEATRFKVSNFAIAIKRCEDYVDGVVKLGLAKKISDKENPLSFFEKGRDALATTSYFIEPFDETRFRKLI